MYDTIKVKIPVSMADWAKVQEKSRKSEKTDPDNPYRKTTYYSQIIMDKRAKVNITLGNQDSIFVEFSVPKYLYGHNLYLLKNGELDIALAHLQDVIYDQYKIDIPDYQKWTLRRMDISYAWRFIDDEVAKGVLAGFKPFTLPKKHQELYDTTIYWKGATKTTRLYLKHPEFMTNNYKELRKWGFISFAEKIKEESIGILRYEVELRDEAITALFGYKDVPVNKLLDGFDCLKYLQDEFMTLIGDPHEGIQNMVDLYNYVLNIAPRRQAWPIFSQLIFTISYDPVFKEALNLIPRSTRKRTEKLFKEYGLIGIPFTLPYKLRLDIPSPNEALPILTD